MTEHDCKGWRTISGVKEDVGFYEEQWGYVCLHEGMKSGLELQRIKGSQFVVSQLTPAR